MLEYQENKHFIQIKGNFNYRYLFILIKRENEDELKHINGIAHFLEHYLINREHILLKNICSTGETNYEKILLMYRFDNSDKFKNLSYFLSQTFKEKYINESIFEKVRNEVLFELKTISQENSLIQIKIISDGKYTVLPMGNIQGIKNVLKSDFASYIEKVNDFEIYCIYVGKEYLIEKLNKMNNNTLKKDSIVSGMQDINYYNNTTNATDIYFRMHNIIKNKYIMKVNYNILNIIINEIYMKISNDSYDNKIIKIGIVYLDRKTTYLHIKIKFIHKKCINKFVKNLIEYQISSEDFKNYKTSLNEYGIKIPLERDFKTIIKEIEDEIFLGIGKTISLTDIKAYKKSLLESNLESFNLFLDSAIRKECFIFKQLGE